MRFVDIDNFYVPRGSPVSSGLLKPGDTSAHLDLCTAQANWNLVYIIISFRSKAKTGCALTYLIRRQGRRKIDRPEIPEEGCKTPPLRFDGD
jgi:hypothetical protein